MVRYRGQLKRARSRKGYKEFTTAFSLFLALIATFFLVTNVPSWRQLPYVPRQYLYEFLIWVQTTFYIEWSSTLAFLSIVVPAFGFFALWITIGVTVRVLGWHLYLKQRAFPSENWFEFDTTLPEEITKPSLLDFEVTTKPPLPNFREMTKPSLLTSEEITKPIVVETWLDKVSYSQSAPEFEREVAKVISHWTGKYAVVTGGARDGGVDIEVYDGTRLVGIVQCKRHSPKSALSPMYIRELKTVKELRGVKIAYLVTTARFSYNSRWLANDLDIRLIDGSALEKMKRTMKEQQSTTLPRKQFIDQQIPTEHDQQSS